MPTWLLAVSSKAWGWLGGAVAVAGAVLLGLAKAKQAGVDAQSAAQAKQDREAANVRITEEANAARAADPAAELHKRWGR